MEGGEEMKTCCLYARVSTEDQEREGTSLQSQLEDCKKLAQEKGYGVSEGFIAELSQSLNIPMSEIYGVATFYSFLATKQLGKNVIRVCKSLPCFLKDSQMIIESVEKETGIKPGETTPDGKFSLQLTNCIGLCDQAPAMMINDDVYGNLTPDKIAQILEAYK